VKAAFPPDSSLLQDLTLTASDDTSASLTAVLSVLDHLSMSDLDPIVSSITDQFAALNIPQTPYVSYSAPDDPDSEPPPSSAPPPSSNPPASS
jgi:hypothetical protein